MASVSNSARNEVLSGVRAALGRQPGEPVPPVPASARVITHVPGPTDREIAGLLAEIDRLGGQTRRVAAGAFHAALAALVQAEGIRKAVFWQTPALQALGVAEILSDLGVEVVSARAGHCALAECDLGVTGVARALPETGTLVLRSSPDCPRAVSLLPRVHLALVRPDDVCADLTQVFQDLRAAPYFVFVTGPSRTADIELTVTLGVHGPQALYVWALE
jgi:L-lactate dehydrogenase complex protein LldG